MRTSFALFRPGLPVRLLLLACLGLVCIGPAGCGVGLDAIYALPLDRPPNEADWAGSVPYRTEARGGATSQAGDADVDGDSVHAVAASCHHGAGAPPVTVEARAFHTPERLYLRFSWTDPTPDGGAVWRWSEGVWRADSERQDGLGILWGGEGGFSCARTCHLKDWRMAGPRAFADYAMETVGGEPLDFWIWKAGRGTIGGMAEDAVLTAEGREGDGPGEFDAPNSVRALAGETGVYAPGDAPIHAPPLEPGSVAAGRTVIAESPGRLEVAAESGRTGTRWILTLSRRLTGSDPGDVTFRAGGEYRFGLAVLDGVSLDHNAARHSVRLVLVPPAAGVVSSGE